MLDYYYKSYNIMIELEQTGNRRKAIQNTCDVNAFFFNDQGCVIISFKLGITTSYRVLEYRSVVPSIEYQK